MCFYIFHPSAFSLKAFAPVHFKFSDLNIFTRVSFSRKEKLLYRFYNFPAGPSARRKRGSKVQRFLMIGVLVGLGFITLIVILSYLARSEDYTDPMLEPMNNPNIRVGSDR